MNYRGRFAPSPSGPLHFGSLIAAVASYLQAKSNNGKWLVRIEDVDIPRSIPGADKLILEALEALKLHWDEKIIYQSQRKQRYQEIISELEQSGKTYPCCCSRKEVGNLPYSGTCRNGLSNDKKATAIRIKVEAQTISFIDHIQASFSQKLDSEVGDFIIRRADNMTSYNLAVVIDDADQKISEVVRGTDLLDTTNRQIFLQHCLGFPTPAYAHFPIAVDNTGKKLSKQNHAPEIDIKQAEKLLIDSLLFLGQKPIKELDYADTEEIIRWSIKHWNIDAVPRRHSICYQLN